MNDLFNEEFRQFSSCKHRNINNFTENVKCSSGDENNHKTLPLSQVKNIEDFITSETWKERMPDLFIEFQSMDSDHKLLYGYNKEKFLEWLSLDQNIFAQWVDAKDMEGHGGYPDRHYLYWKLYPDNFLIRNRQLITSLQKHVTYLVRLQYQKQERLGNLQGIFGQSMLHGQAPGYPVYSWHETLLLLPLNADDFRIISDPWEYLQEQYEILNFQEKIILATHVTGASTMDWHYLLKKDFGVKDCTLIHPHEYYLTLCQEFLHLPVERVLFKSLRRDMKNLFWRTITPELFTGKKLLFLSIAKENKDFDSYQRILNYAVPESMRQFLDEFPLEMLRDKKILDNEDFREAVVERDFHYAGILQRRAPPSDGRDFWSFYRLCGMEVIRKIINAGNSQIIISGEPASGKIESVPIPFSGKILFRERSNLAMEFKHEFQKGYTLVELLNYLKLTLWEQAKKRYTIQNIVIEENIVYYDLIL